MKVWIDWRNQEVVGYRGREDVIDEIIGDHLNDPKDFAEYLNENYLPGEVWGWTDADRESVLDAAADYFYDTAIEEFNSQYQEYDIEE